MQHIDFIKDNGHSTWILPATSHVAQLGCGRCQAISQAFCVIGCPAATAKTAMEQVGRICVITSCPLQLQPRVGHRGRLGNDKDGCCHPEQEIHLPHDKPVDFLRTKGGWSIARPRQVLRSHDCFAGPINLRRTIDQHIAALRPECESKLKLQPKFFQENNLREIDPAEIWRTVAPSK